MAEGNEIGKVYVKIVPSAEGFRKKAREEIQREASALEGEAEVKPDTSGFASRAQRNIDRELDGVTGEVEIEGRLERAFRSKINAELGRISDSVDTKLLIEGDLRTEQLRRDLDEKIAEIEATAQSINIDMEVDEAFVARAKVLALLAELQAIARTNPVDIQVKVDNNSFINSIKMAWARAMASLGSLQMSDPLGSMSPMLNLFRGMDTAITKANGSMSKMSFLGKNLSTILSAIPAQWIFIGVAVASVVSPILALLSGLIVAAPAALAAVMWPIGAITLGLDGIKKAAENAGLFADKNGDKKGGGALGASLDAIKKKASDAFEQGLKPAFASINNLLANVDFQDSFGKVAEGLSGMFGGVTTGLEKSQGALTNIGNNIGKAFADAAPGIEAFTTGLLNLISKLSDKFPGISEAINRTGDSFVKWVDEITMKDPITGVSQLDVAMKGLGDTLSGMGGFVTDLFKDGWDNMTNGGFVESMKQFVESVRSIVTDILPGLADAFQTVASSLEGIANLIEPFAWFFDKLDQIGGQGNKSGIPDWVPLIGSWDDILGEWFGDGSETQGILEGAKLAQAIQAGIKDNGLVAGTKLGAEGFIDPSIGEAIKNQIVGGINASKEEQKAALLSAFTDTGVDQAVSNQLTTQVTAAVEGAKQAMAGLAPEVQAQIDTAMAPLGDIAGRIGSAFDGVGPLIQGSLGQIPGIIAGVFEGITPTVAASVQGITDAFVTGGATIIAEVEGWGPRITAPLQSLAGTMQIIGVDVANGLAAGIRAGTQAAVAAAAAMASAVEAASRGELKTKSPSRVFMDIGDNVSQGLAIGIENGANGPIEAIKAILQAIKDVFGNASGINLNFNMGQMSTAMSSIAADSKTFSDNMITTGKSTGAATGATQSQLDAIARDKAALNVQIKELQLQKGQTADKNAKAALQTEIDALELQKERLNLMKEEDKLNGDRQSAIKKLSDQIATSLVDMMKMPQQFAMATANAAMQDVGISGQGALPTIANWALDAGTNFIFNVNNMDDAIQGQQAQQNKQTAGIIGR